MCKKIDSENLFFSVIIPYYNKKDTVMQTVDSVINQSFKSFEIIVIDDGSTDGLDFDELKKRGCRILHQSNSGVSEARNHGIREAKGIFVCFLDADDFWLPNHLDTLYNLVCRYSEYSYFCTSHRTLYENGIIKYSSCHLNNFEGQDFACANLFELLNNTSDAVIHTNSICIRTSALMDNSIFFAVGVTNGEDSDMWFRVALMFPIVISKIETTQYCKEYSTASRGVEFIDTWIFETRMNEIEQDGNIDPEVKQACQKLVDRYYMQGCRYYKSKNNKQKARALLDKVKYRKNLKYMFTKCCLFAPVFIVKKVMIIRG